MPKFPEITDRFRSFIEQQQIFFVGTAAPDGRVNISPKGMDTLRVLGPYRIVWLSLTGGENESAAHLRETPRMTLMWCAFEGTPMILRAYDNDTVIHPRDPGWDELAPLFPALPGARQIFDLTVDLVLRSCGMGAPLFEFRGAREALRQWAERIGDSGIKEWWQEHNQVSLDGKPTGILEA
jgi:Pyridoxamine 5'-phosphate oxidase